MPSWKDHQKPPRKDDRPPDHTIQRELDEQRDPTDDELRSVTGALGVSNTRIPLPTATAPSGSDETDEEVAEHQARIRQQEVAAAFPVGPSAPGIPVEGQMLTPEQFQARMLKALESVEARSGGGGGGGTSDFMAMVMLQLTEALKGLRDATITGAQMQADMQRRVHTPENKTAPMISTYNPRGDKDFPRPPPKCEMFLPWPVHSDWESITREEAELLNLLQPGEWTITRSDRSRVKMRVTIQTRLDSDEPSRLLVHHDTAFNNDNHRQMPYDWIRQLATVNPKTRDAANAVLTMEEEAALILARKFNDGRLAEKGERLVSVGE